jgi:hypothetical protein
MKRDLALLLVIAAFILGMMVGRLAYESEYYEIYYDCANPNLPSHIERECRPRGYV